MKILRKKLKKVHIAKKIAYYLSSILYLACLIYFIIGILKLNIDHADILIIKSIIIAIFCIWYLLYLLMGLITMIAKKTKTFIFLTIMTLLMCPIFVGTSYFINNIYGTISNMNRNTIEYSTNLIALKETSFNSKLHIGMVTSETDNLEGSVLGKKLIEKEKLTNKIYEYEDYDSMLADLEKGKIGGAIVPSNYDTIINNYEDDIEDKNRESLAKRIKILYSYSEERENQDVVTLSQSKDKTLTEPFTVLVMGVDSAKDGLKANQAFNGDTLMLITFNPNTLTATMFSLPRDLYVPIACNHNKYAKINSSAAYGSSCVIKTVQQLTDITIDYYVKINFTGVVELIDAMGGVTVEVEEPDYQFNRRIDCKGMVCEQNSKRQFGNEVVFVPTGKQTLNGEQALAYARNRHQWAIGDIARNQHQQQVIEGMAHSLKGINSITEFQTLLETVSNNIETNMTPEQMMSFYTVGKDMLANSSGNALSIQKTYLSYYSLPVWQPRAERYTSALGYYPESLEAIVHLMKVNLELESEEPIKTMSFSINEDYTTPLVGKGLTGGQKLERVKAFEGLTEYEAMTWCQMNQISCSFESTNHYYEYGIIASQSAHEGELLASLKSITFYVSDGLGTPPESEIPNDEELENPDINDNPTDDNTENDNNDSENNQGNEDTNTGDNETNKPSTDDNTTPEQPTDPSTEIPGGPGETTTE